MEPIKKERDEKVCMDEDHSDTILTFICYDKECKELGRTMCQDCVLMKKTHKKCKKFLKFDRKGLQIFDVEKKRGGVINDQVKEVEK